MPTFEVIDPAFKALVLPNAPLLTLGEGCAWLEGPIWFADADHLLVSDLPNDRILRWRRPAAEQPERRHGAQRRRDLIHRPVLRHQHRLRGRQAAL